MSVKSVPSNIIILSLMIFTVVKDKPVGATVTCTSSKYIGFERVADLPLMYDVYWLGPLR